MNAKTIFAPRNSSLSGALFIKTASIMSSFQKISPLKTAKRQNQTDMW